MRNMLALFALVLLTTLGVGWYLDWYRIRPVPAPDGQKTLTVDINTRKIGQDLQRAEQAVQQRLEEKARAAREEAARAAREEATRGKTQPTNAMPYDWNVFTD